MRTPDIAAFVHFTDMSDPLDNDNTLELQADTPTDTDRCYYGCGKRARVNSFYCSVECAIRAEMER